MAQKINLAKGGKIDLSKGMTNALVGLGWTVKEFAREEDIDLDVSVFLLDESERMRDASDLVFYGSSKIDGKIMHPSGAVVHTGDNRVGGDGQNDDEQVLIDFSKIPDYVQTMKVVITIYKWKQRKQNFGMIKHAYARLISTNGQAVADNGAEELRFDLSEDHSSESSMLMATIYRHNGRWRFKPDGEGFPDGLGAFIRKYGFDYEGDD